MENLLDYNTWNWRSALYAFVVIAVIVLVFIVVLRPYWQKQEGYVGRGLMNYDNAGMTGAISSGATMRRLGTSFTQPGQGTYSAIHLADLRDKLPTPFDVGHVANAEPDFSAVGSLLEDYTRSHPVHFDGEDPRLVGQLYA